MPPEEAEGDETQEALLEALEEDEVEEVAAREEQLVVRMDKTM